MTVINNELGNRLDGLKMAIEALPWSPQYSTEVNAFNMMMERLDRIKEDFGLVHRYDAHIVAWNQVKNNWATRCEVVA